MAPDEVGMKEILRRLTCGVGVIVWFFVASVGHGQSLDPHKPAPLGAGINKGNIQAISMLD